MSKLDRLLDKIEGLPPSEREMAWELAVGAKSLARRQMNAAHRELRSKWSEAEKIARSRLEATGDDFCEDDVNDLAEEILYGQPEDEFSADNDGFGDEDYS